LLAYYGTTCAPGTYGSKYNTWDEWVDKELEAIMRIVETGFCMCRVTEGMSGVGKYPSWVGLINKRGKPFIDKLSTHYVGALKLEHSDRRGSS
jgi:hypothetical protein